MSGIVQHITLNSVRGYSGAQRAGFIGILIGFVMCVIGCFPPYWKTGSISMDTPIKIDVKMMDVNAGLWLFCVKFIGMEKKCSSTIDVVDTMHEIYSGLDIKDNSKQWLVIIWGASALCLILSLVCGLAACCRFCCCNGGRTVCHGIMAFLAGACGIAAVVVFSLKADDIYGFSILDLDDGWAMFLFACGAGIMVISSFMLCFFSPRESNYQLMSSPSPMPVVTTQTSTSAQMNAASFPPVQQPVMYREMDSVPMSAGYGYDQSSSQPKQH